MCDDEEKCSKCGECNDDVMQCWKCDILLCVDCDENEMATYGKEYHTYCYECGEKVEEEEFKEEKFKYPNRCRKIDGEWVQYLGAGNFCKPEEKPKKRKKFIIKKKK